jgi:hypothetical protein
MEDETDKEPTRAGMSETEMRANVVRLAFGGDPARFDAFCRALQEGIPPETAAVLRGSAVTGVRHEDGAPFDADGPGTSDLDLTLVGNDVIDWFTSEGFYIPGAHTKPLSAKDPDIAPKLVPLRRKLIAMVNRPVDIQATKDWVMFLREYVLAQPYLTLVGKLQGS